MLSCCKGIIYVNYAMLCCWANHHVCELYHAIIFLYYVFHLSTTFVYSTTLPVHQPFEAVMEVSGVKTRYSEQTMLPAEADILLVTESSSEEDSETDDQSYFPPEVYAQTWQGYITHVMHVVLHCLVFTSYMDCHLLTCLLYKSYIWIISCHHVYIHIIYLNYGMATHLIKTSYSYIISSCLVFTVIIFWIMAFYPLMYVNYGMPTYLINTLYSYVMSSCLHSLIFWTMSFHLF